MVRARFVRRSRRERDQEFDASGRKIHTRRTLYIAHSPRIWSMLCPDTSGENLLPSARCGQLDGFQERGTSHSAPDYLFEQQGLR